MTDAKDQVDMDVETQDSANALVAIGISFGNCHSSIAYTNAEGKAEVIANEEGDRNIPSILSYIDGEEFHGTQAKVQLVRNSSNTIAYFRDFLGSSFDAIDPTHCHASAHPQQCGDTVAFEVQDGKDGQEGKDGRNIVSVEEVTIRHIRRLKQSASDYLGKTVNAAVITVPTNMNQNSKDVLTAAASAAGVQVLQMISEPTAALLAYDARSSLEASTSKSAGVSAGTSSAKSSQSAESPSLQDKIIVVADFGGTRSDVAVIASRAGMYSVLATQHDRLTAGVQLDQVLIDHFAKEFMKKHKTDPRSDSRSLAKLKLEAEATKKALSLGANASLSVESLADGIDYTSTINRTRYELLAGKVFQSFTRLIEETIRAADLDVIDIDEVILSGGTSHTPRIASNLAGVFPSHTRMFAPATLANAIDPSSLAARGAAIQASLIADFDQEDIDQSTHPAVTVTPHLSKTIGLMLVAEDTTRGVFHPLIAKDTAIPCRRAITLSAPKQGGNVMVKVCEAHRDIKVTKPPAPVKAAGKPETKSVNGTRGKSHTIEDDSGSDSDSDFSDEEPEEVRERIWTVDSILAEAAVRDISTKDNKDNKETKDSKNSKNSKVEVIVHVSVDRTVQISARQVGSQGGVRGTLEGIKT